MMSCQGQRQTTISNLSTPLDIQLNLNLELLTRIILIPLLERQALCPFQVRPHTSHRLAFLTGTATIGK